MKLTKQAVKRFYNSPIEVKLWNGCYNRAVVVSKFSRHRYELKVCVTHPSLQWQCGNVDEVSIVHYENATGGTVYSEIPAELAELVEQLKVAATMTDEEANALSKENSQVFLKAAYDLGM